MSLKSKHNQKLKTTTTMTTLIPLLSRLQLLLLLLLCHLPTASSQPSSSTIPSSTPTDSPTSTNMFTILEKDDIEILESVPHDPNAFTQGLELLVSRSTTTTTTTTKSSNSYYAYESTGRYGSSSMRIVNIKNGNVLYQYDLENDFFAEGATYYNNQILQLTWKSGIGFIYDIVLDDNNENDNNDGIPKELVPVDTFFIDTTNGQGWGICYPDSGDIDGDEDILYVSDGTEYIHTWNAETKQLLSKVPVTRQLPPLSSSSVTSSSSGPSTVRNINELEWDRFSNTILANVWQQDYIIRIDPNTGFVTHQYDLSTLIVRQVERNNPSVDVLNGIAITNIPNEIWVTGKLYPTMYRIRLPLPGGNDTIISDNSSRADGNNDETTSMSAGGVFGLLKVWMWLSSMILVVFFP